MKEVREQRLTGERALFHSEGLNVEYCIFADGESPLKESRDIKLTESLFQWKYPLWYCRDIEVDSCTFEEMARAGIWYTNNISVRDTLYGAPKGFRRVNNLHMSNVDMPRADETLWTCKDVVMNNISAKGDYFGMNCKNVKIDGLHLIGNYCFDGGENIELHNGKLLSKDAFWNCHNVTVYDSIITGEYLGWNSTNLTFINCTIESLQGLCYIDNLVMKNCRLLNTTLAFEYSTVDVDVVSKIDSVINPAGGIISCKQIDELIMDEKETDPSKTEIIYRGEDK
jgi:hypothetical protein